jgi:colicin import membrane protein
MPRPQKYTDSDISNAIEFLACSGEDVNPMRVRMRLGGGNITRIKAILDKQSSQLGQTAAAMARIPDALLREFQRLSGEVSQQMQLLANRCWTFACTAAASEAQRENEQLRRRLEKLEPDLAASTDLVVQVEGEREEARRDFELCTKEKGEFAKQCEGLKAALRNAESDLRASQKVIETFDRNQRQDRIEIRQLQKRIEELVAELATLKASPLKSTPSRKAADRKKMD